MNLYISFGLDTRSLDSPFINQEGMYQNLYKKCARFLFANKDFPMFFSFTENQLQFFKKRHPEFIEVYQKLILRNQIEILGGGAHNPIFPLLFPLDRKGQIDELSTQIHQLFGKRPRGMSLYESCWDAALLPSIKSCGMDYLLLDSSLLPSKNISYIPNCMTFLDKTLDIIPLHQSCAPSETIVPEAYLESLWQSVKNQSNLYHNYISDRFIHVHIPSETFSNLLDTDYFLKLLAVAKDSYNGMIKFVLPSYYRKCTQVREPIYISHGIRESIAKHAFFAQEKNYPVSIYDFFQKHAHSRVLYYKMLYTATLINQYHGDKARKKEARKILWKAQNGKALLCNSSGFFEPSRYRQYIYQCLALAESPLRDANNFEEGVSSFDYDGDGINDYLFRMSQYTALVSLIGGSVRELSIASVGFNYADNLSRVAQYDGYFDDYYRGLFVDHVFSESLLKDYIQNKNVTSGIFPNLKYDESSFVSKRKELTLSAHALLEESSKSIRIQKKYSVSSSGFSVQYIVKNESEDFLDTFLAIESNISQANFTQDDFEPYAIEIICGGEKKEADTLSSTFDIQQDNILSNVNLLQISDNTTYTSFIFEANEPCNFCFAPITYTRFDGEKNVKVGMSFFSAFIWHIQLEGKKEVEKTINFSILNTKKKRIRGKKEN